MWPSRRRENTDALHKPVGSKDVGNASSIATDESVVTAGTQGWSADYSKEADMYNYDLPKSDFQRRSGYDKFLSGDWIDNPRIKHCFSNLILGMKMGGMVGAAFGGLVGTVHAAKERRLVILPASVLISAGSFAFFLGCGMLVRC